MDFQSRNLDKVVDLFAAAFRYDLVTLVYSERVSRFFFIWLVFQMIIN
jgi:hypothetical protein